MKNRLSSRAFIFQSLLVVGIVALLAALWKQRADFARVTKEYEQLRAQHAGLQKNLSPARAEPDRAAATPPQVQPPASEGGSTQELRQGQDAAALQPKAHPPEPEPNRLALAGTEVHAIPGGLQATLRFTPRKSGPLGLVALTIRLPKNVDAKILDLAPVGSTIYTDFSKEVPEDGRFAFFQGTLREATNVQFALSVSGPAAANVRGTCGIGAFQLEIQPAGASVRGN